MELSLVNHLFVTARFVVKGTVRTGDLRLSSWLNAQRRPWIQVEQTTFADLVTGEQVAARRASLRLGDVLFAHEFVALQGDPVRRRLAEERPDDFRMASCWFRAPACFELLGRVRREALDPAAADEFFVMREPLLRGGDARDRPVLEPCRNLSYAIVQRAQLHGFFEYE
jgi:hypothetical protein